MADPVVVVSHHTNANWTSSLPSREKTCPVHTAKKGRIEAGFVARTCSVVFIILSFYV
jgi:hypothetical protein